jgi:hypothetical protein
MLCPKKKSRKITCVVTLKKLSRGLAISAPHARVSGPEQLQAEMWPEPSRETWEGEGWTEVTLSRDLCHSRSSQAVPRTFLL